jgi:hypothetical protein
MMFFFVAMLLMAACGNGDRFGTAWGSGAFRSNGEQIYFTSTSERGTEIDYSGGPDLRGMMMRGRLSCASCHGADVRGGVHIMHMDVMDAPDIRWVSLSEHGGEHDEGNGETDEAHDDDPTYDLETFRLAVTQGMHPDGRSLSEDMPRWVMTEDDLGDLAEYLQSFSAP